MKIEVIATSLQDSILAEEAGAHRIELVSAIAEGGLTPSYGLIEQVVNNLSIPVNVMIRPHSKSFLYDEYDMDVILKDIEVCKSIGVAGIVFGSLTEQKMINEIQLQAVLDASKGLDITFHRAFDEVDNQIEGLICLQKYNAISRVLTSGGQVKVTDAKAQIKALIHQSNVGNKIIIMPGSGLNENVLPSFIKNLEVHELHFGSGVRTENSFFHPIDQRKIKRLKKICSC